MLKVPYIFLFLCEAQSILYPLEDELAMPIPVYFLVLSSRLFFCSPVLLFPFTVSCRMSFKPEDIELWPNHLSFRSLIKFRRSSYFPMAVWIFLRISLEAPVAQWVKRWLTNLAVPSSNLARSEIFLTANGVPLHTAFHYHSPIVLI